MLEKQEVELSKGRKGTRQSKEMGDTGKDSVGEPLLLTEHSEIYVRKHYDETHYQMLTYEISKSS